MINELFERLMNIDEGAQDIRKLYVDTGKVPEEMFNEFMEADMSKTKKYLEWMCREYTQNKERRGHIKDVVQEFDRLARAKKIQDPDIYKYSLEEVDELINELHKKVSKTQQKKKVKEQGAVKVFENDKVVVFHILTEEASCLYGANTKWCTAAKEGRNYWYDYHEGRKANLYYTITKQNPPKKFAVVSYHGGKTEVYDELDNPISLAKYKKMLGEV